MTIEFIGFLLILAGLASLSQGYRATATVFVLTTLFGAAAAMFIGGANIQPAHMFLGFLAIGVAMRPEALRATAGVLTAPAPGFWLACLVGYAVLTAFMLPRLLAGSTLIIPLGITEFGADAVRVPLVPGSSNFTQSVYLVGDLLCFVLVAAIASSASGFKAITNALLMLAAGNIMFALVDILTYHAGAQHWLDWIRNARYTMHEEENVNGLKRIVGSFPEAAAFSAATSGLAAFTCTLFLCGRQPVLTGLLGLTSIVLLVLSTSSAGMIGAAALVVLLYLTGLKLASGRRSTGVIAAVTLAPLVAAICALAVLLNEPALAAIQEYIDTVILSKLSTNSGITRSSWNDVAIQNIIDTWGLGVGLGTIRTSNFAIALLSNVGVIGTLLFVIFLASVLFRRVGRERSLPSDVRMAARNGCLGVLACGLLVAPTVDPGLMFCVLAALASAVPERVPRPVARPVAIVGQPAI